MTGTLTDRMDGNLFRIERALSKVHRMNVSTIRRPHNAVFTLNYRWQLVLDPDQIDHLIDYLDSDHAFAEEVNKLLDECMCLTEFST